MKKLRLIRGSEVGSYLNCRRSWKLAWVDHLKKKTPDGKLFFGELFHKYLELFYECMNKQEAWTQTVQWLDQQDMSDMDQEFIDELLQLFDGVSQNYMNEYAEQDILKFNVLATELRFAIPLLEDDPLDLAGGMLDFAYEGTIDLLYLEDGLLKFSDHKTVSSIDRYVNNAVLDRQISRYWWALTALGQGYGYIWTTPKKNHPAWEKQWVPVKETDLYESIKNQSPSEFVYNIIGKTAPKAPKLLVKGGLSKAKDQNTTLELYKKAIVENSLKFGDYTEMLEMLERQGNKFLRRVSVVRNMSECQAAIEDFAKVGQEIMQLRWDLENAPEAAERHLFWHITWDTPTFNSYYPLIQAEVKGENINMVKALLYETKEPEEPEYIEVEEM